MAQFEIGANLAGKTLLQLASETKAAFRPDILAGSLGITDRTPLRAGQVFNLPDDPGSSEFQFASSFFSPAGTAQKAEQASFLEEQRGRVSEFTGRLQEVPTTLEAINQL